MHRDHELHVRRRGRNLGVFALLIGFAVLIFAVTIVKVGGGPGTVGNPSAAQGGGWISGFIEWVRS